MRIVFLIGLLMLLIAVYNFHSGKAMAKINPPQIKTVLIEKQAVVENNFKPSPVDPDYIEPKPGDDEEGPIAAPREEEVQIDYHLPQYKYHWAYSNTQAFEIYDYPCGIHSSLAEDRIQCLRFDTTSPDFGHAVDELECNDEPKPAPTTLTRKRSISGGTVFEKCESQDLDWVLIDHECVESRTWDGKKCLSEEDLEDD